MTDTAFYQRMDALATRLLTKFGAPATYRTFPPKPKPNAQGVVVKPAPVDAPGLAVRTESQAVLNMFDQATSAAFVVKFPAEPRPEGQLIQGGVTWKVQEAKNLKPVGSFLVGFVSCVEP